MSTQAYAPYQRNSALPVWVGVDASVKRNSTRHGDRGTWDREARKKARLVWHRIFTPSPREPIDFERIVEETLLDIKRRFSLRAVYYDPMDDAGLGAAAPARGRAHEGVPPVGCRT